MARMAHIDAEYIRTRLHEPLHGGGLAARRTKRGDDLNPAFALHLFLVPDGVTAAA